MVAPLGHQALRDYKDLQASQALRGRLVRTVLQFLAFRGRPVPLDLLALLDVLVQLAPLVRLAPQALRAILVALLDLRGRRVFLELLVALLGQLAPLVLLAHKAPPALLV